MHQRTAQITELAIFTAVAFIFSYVESLFPLPIPFPGIKLGFANLVILIVLYRDGFASALAVSMVRNILNALTFGSLFGFFYSLAGSLLSLCVMHLLKRATERPYNQSKKHPQLSLIGISAVGGIFHNLGQFFVAACLVGFSALLRYLPFLYFAGLIAGILIGILALLCLQRLPKQISNRN
ncbi:MAG: Gx transporter family protein [Lachnospiraceae bacterium]|nr:Gx transporter family protein [Lachnospiraceae bacterium]